MQPVLTLVSHRWHRVFYSEPALWWSLELTAESLDKVDVDSQAEEWFAAKASLLRRIGRFVQRLCYSQMLEDDTYPGADDGISIDAEQVAADWGAEWQLGSSVLAHLSPATLQSLRLEWAPADAATAAALQRWSGLTQLQIRCRGNLPSSLPVALPSLPQLLSLELGASALPLGLPTVLQHLRSPALQQLSRFQG